MIQDNLHFSFAFIWIEFRLNAPDWSFTPELSRLECHYLPFLLPLRALLLSTVSLYHFTSVPSVILPFVHALELGWMVCQLSLTFLSLPRRHSYVMGLVGQGAL